jgi:hypothetical protein
LKPDAQESEQEKQQLQIDQANALLVRIKFVRSLYQIVHYSDEHQSFVIK